MTIDELKARKRELQKQKNELLPCGDNFDFFVINEELLEVNAQIRSLQGNNGRVGSRQISSDGCRFSVDKQIYQNWLESQNGEICQNGAELRKILGSAKEILTDKQYQYLQFWSSGVTMDAVGKHFGVATSTVSRTISRAKARLSDAAQAEEEKNRLDSRIIDVSDPDMAQRILKALTAKQAVYLYLYYAEWLSLREIAELLGIKSHQSVMVSIHSGLRNIGRVFGYSAIEVKNMSAMNDLVYTVYQSIDPQQLLPEEVREQVKRHSGTRPGHYIPLKDLPHITIDMKHGISDATWLGQRAERQGAWKPGKLLEELLKKSKDGVTLRKWLTHIFKHLTKNLGGKLRWK